MMKFFLCFYLFCLGLCKFRNDEYRIGVGIADISGKKSLENHHMMGYGELKQATKGVYLPLFARTVIAVHKETKTRIAHVTCDLAFISNGVKMYVVKELKKDLKIGHLYNDETVMIAATHTHSGPGGYEFSILYDLSKNGFQKDTFHRIVSGIVSSIKMAHENLSESGRIRTNEGELLDSGINRSLYAHEQNEDKDDYPGPTDTIMKLLLFEKQVLHSQFEPVASITYFPVHPTSVTNENRLVHSDNKGIASYLLERNFWKRKCGEENPLNFIYGGEGNNTSSDCYFVASFPQPNHADVTPNILGAKCVEMKGLPDCPYKSSKCEKGPCVGIGPGGQGLDGMYESAKIIGKRIFEKTKELIDDSDDKFHLVKGKIRVAHQYVEMNSVEIDAKYTHDKLEKKTTCVACGGQSMLAGTSDGEGFRLFDQGDTRDEENLLDKTLNTFIQLVFGNSPGKELKECQGKKAISVVLGKPIGSPYFKHQAVQTRVPIHIVTFGKDLVIAGLPTEITTQSGRRIRKMMKERLTKKYQWDDKKSVFIEQSLTNAFVGYLATWEEYQVQRYEGGSTLFGPETLGAYMQLVDNLLIAMFEGEKIDKGPSPSDLYEDMRSHYLEWIADWGRIGRNYIQVKENYTIDDGVNSIVTFSFVGSTPQSFVYENEKNLVEIWKKKLNDDDGWEVVMTESDYRTRFKCCKKRGTPKVYKEAIVEFEAIDGVEEGTYMIVVFGGIESVQGGKKKGYMVESNEFVLLKNKEKEKEKEDYGNEM